MEISNVITILLFILPGMLSDKVTHMLDYPTENDPSDFIKTVNGILSSLPILFVNSILFAVCNKVTSLEDFIRLFDNLLLLGLFIIVISLTSVLFGFFRLWVRESQLKILNIIRKSLGKMEVNNGSCWQKFLIEKNECRYLEVIIEGQLSKGFAGGYSTLKEDKSIILETDKSLYMHDDYDPEKLFTKVIGTYIDIEKNVIIKDYDMSDYDKWVEEKETISLAEVEV